MIIYLISAVFPPEPVSSAITSSQIAQEIELRGHFVTVFTNFPNRPAGKLYSGYNRKFYSKQALSDRHQIIRCYTIFSQKSTIISRSLENISFGISSGLALLFSKKPDVIYSNSWAIFATGIVCLVARIRHIPLVISIQDMYPESLVSQGRIKENSLLYHILLFIDTWNVQSCRTIIFISDQFVMNYCKLRKINSDNIKVIPNWTNSDAIKLLGKTVYRIETGIPDDAFVFLYGGNIGVAAGIETIFEALGQISIEKELYLVIAGSGSQLQTCQRLACNLTNIHVLFHSPWYPDETSKVLAAADVLILPTRGKQSLASVPSKLISYLLASRPVLALSMADSEITKIITEADCGWIVEPDNKYQLANMMRELANMPKEILISKGSAGRTYALNHFTSEICLPKVIQAILNG